MKLTNRPPVSFWIIATAAIVWNIIEFYFSSYELSLIQENATVDELIYFENLPIWFVTVFLLALFCEMLGAFALFMRRKIAVKLYGVAFFALLIIEFYWLFIIDFSRTNKSYITMPRVGFVVTIYVNN